MLILGRPGEVGRLLIADCRSSVAAVGNAVESSITTATPIIGAEHLRIDIANHHAMRASVDVRLHQNEDCAMEDQDSSLEKC